MQITFKNKKGEVINDSNWEASWKPKKETQWKDGRSSKEFAKFASKEYFFTKLISQVLTSCGITEQNFTCTPEYESSLGKGFGKGGLYDYDIFSRCNSLEDTPLAVGVRFPQLCLQKMLLLRVVSLSIVTP